MFWELRRKERSLWFGRRGKSILSRRHPRNKRSTIFSSKQLSSWISSKCHTFQMCVMYLERSAFMSWVLLNHLSQQWTQDCLPHPGRLRAAQPGFALPQLTDDNCTARGNSACNRDLSGKSCPARSITNSKLRDAYRYSICEPERGNCNNHSLCLSNSLYCEKAQHEYGI